MLLSHKNIKNLKHTRLTVQGLKRYADKNYDLDIADNIQRLIMACSESSVSLGMLTNWKRDNNLVVSYCSAVEYRAELDRVVSYLTHMLAVAVE